MNPTLAGKDHPVWQEVAPELHRFEFNHPDKMDPGFLRLLIRIRRASGVPFRIVSDWRDPAENPGASKSTHLEEPCRAVDLRVINNAERYRLIKTALEHGVNRIGVYPPNEWQRQRFGKGSGSVHLDGSRENPGSRMWMSW